jgi:RNA-binding protein with serine-rich domain 1
VLSPYKIVQLDTTDEASILRAAEDLKDEAIDLVINNAGITIGGGLDVTTKEEMLQQFDVNCVGPFLVTRALIPHLKAAVAKHGAASVVQVSSYLSSIALNVGGMFGCYGYRASKAALNMTMVSLALDLQSDGVATFAIHPGHVSTDINNYTGEISLDTSVGGMVPLIQKLTIADTGKFYDYNGNSLPW